MQFLRRHCKPIAGVVSLFFGLMTFYVPGAQAGIVDTNALLAAEQNRAKIENLLSREQVRQELIAQGVDVEQAHARVAALSDAELEQLAGKIDELPAGGDVVGAAVFVFLVLLVTDLLGLTDIFPFVRKPEERR